MKLLHKVLPERVNEDILESISKYGLLPRLPCEYKQSLPKLLQEVPIVWLAERMNTIDGVIYSVDVEKLDNKNLYKLDWADVDWWVYVGTIGPDAIEPLVEE